MKLFSKNKDRILAVCARASSFTSIITGIVALSGVGLAITLPIGIGLNIAIFGILCAIEFSEDTVIAFNDKFKKNFNNVVVSESDVTILYELRQNIDSVISASEFGSEPIYEKDVIYSRK